VTQLARAPANAVRRQRDDKGRRSRPGLRGPHASRPGLKLVKLGGPADHRQHDQWGSAATRAVALDAAVASWQAHRGRVAPGTLDIGATTPNLRRPAGLPDRQVRRSRHIYRRHRPPRHDPGPAEGGLPGPASASRMNYLPARVAEWRSGCPATWSPGQRRSGPPSTTPGWAGLRQSGARSRTVRRIRRLRIQPAGRNKRPAQRRRLFQWTWECAARPAANSTPNQAGYQVSARASCKPPA